MIAAVAWMWYSAPDNNRSIQRFRQARKSLAKGRRHAASDPSTASSGQSSVTVTSTHRRLRSERVIDLRDNDPGPARWPADGWSLGSAAGTSARGSGSGRTPASSTAGLEETVRRRASRQVASGSATQEPAEPPPALTPWEARVAARQAQKAAAETSRAEAPERTLTPWEARVAAREAREAAERPARRAAAQEARQAAQGGARGTRPAVPVVPPARPRLATQPPMPAAPRSTAPAPRHAARQVQPAATIQQRIAERPRHAAVSGQRDTRARRSEHDRRAQDTARWSVIDLTQPEPTVRSGTGPIPAKATATKPTPAKPAPTKLVPAQPAPAAAGEVFRLDPLSYFDRPAAPPATPGHAAPHAPGGSPRRGPDRGRTDPGFTPHYRQVGGVSYVAADRLGEPEQERRARRA